MSLKHRKSSRAVQPVSSDDSNGCEAYPGIGSLMDHIKAMKICLVSVCFFYFVLMIHFWIVAGKIRLNFASALQFRLWCGNFLQE